MRKYHRPSDKTANNKKITEYVRSSSHKPLNQEAQLRFRFLQLLGIGPEEIECDFLLNYFIAKNL